MWNRKKVMGLVSVLNKLSEVFRDSDVLRACNIERSSNGVVVQVQSVADLKNIAINAKSYQANFMQENQGSSSYVVRVFVGGVEFYAFANSTSEKHVEILKQIGVHLEGGDG